MARHILGIDIRTHAVSSVLVKTALKGSRIEAQAKVSITGHQDLEKGISTCLEAINDIAPLSGAVCLAAFSADQIFFRNLRVPFKEEKKIRQILPYELEPLLLQPVDDLIIDFFPIGLSHTADIVTAAIDKPKLEPCLAALAAFKLEPKIITAGSFATACCLTRMDDIPKNFIFLDVNPTECTLCLIVSGEINFVRSFSTGSNPSPDAGLLSTQIKRTISAFTQTLSQDFHPEALFISGAGMQEDTLTDGLSQHLNLTAEPLDLANAKGFFFENSVLAHWNPAQMDGALALTLIELEDIDVLNLRKGPLAVKTQWLKYRNEAVKTGILAGLVLLLIFSGIIVNSFTLKKKIDRLDARILSTFKAAFPEVEKIVDPLQQMQTRLKSARQQFAYPEETESKILQINILNDISSLVPADTDLELIRLVTGPEIVLVSGQTDTFNSVNIIKNSLEKGPLFEKITISSANIDKSENRVRFNLKIELRSEADTGRRVISGADRRKGSKEN